MIKLVSLVSAAIALGYAGRRHLVDLLTKATGTWVGTPRDNGEQA